MPASQKILLVQVLADGRPIRRNTPKTTENTEIPRKQPKYTEIHRKTTEIHRKTPKTNM